MQQLSTLRTAARGSWLQRAGVTAGSICHCSQVCCSSKPGRHPPAEIILLQLRKQQLPSPIAGFHPRPRAEPAHSQDKGCCFFFFCANIVKPFQHVCSSQAAGAKPRAVPAPLMGHPVTILPGWGSQPPHHSQALAEQHSSEKPPCQEDTMADKCCCLGGMGL